MYNDTTYNPSTNAYPQLHSDFSEQILLEKANCPSVTPTKIKEKTSCFRGRLHLLISNWHLSGNGDSQIDTTNSNFGHCDFVDGSDRASFLKASGAKPHHLYVWQLFIECEVLYHTLSKLPDDFLVSSSSPKKPLVYSYSSRDASKNIRSDLEKERLVMQKEATLAIKNLANSGNTSELRELQVMKNTLELDYVRATDAAIKQVLKKQYEEATKNYYILSKKLGMY